MKAVIYARYSCDNQREESIEGQLRECNEFAQKNDYVVVNTYIDRAMSAKTDDRPQFQKMIRESASHQFDVVIVWKLDRFCRNRYDSAHNKMLLKKNNVKVVSATEAISEGAEGIILESMLEGIAEYYSAELSEKVIRGMTENALKCQYNGGNVTLGYKIDEEKHYQIDELIAPFIVEAFNMYIAGKQSKEIVEYLNNNGVRTNGGKPITKTTITSILQNRKYIGEYRYRDVVKANGVPAIIDEETFELAQERLAKNRHAPAAYKAPERYIMSSKVFCAECGAAMVGESGKNPKGIIYRYYKCSNAKKRKCSCKAIRCEEFETAVINYTVNDVLTDELLDAITDKVYVYQEQDNAVIPLLEQELEDREKKISNIVKAIENGIFTESTQERLTQLETEKKDIEAKIAQEKLQSVVLTKQQIRSYLDKMKKLDLLSEGNQQLIVDTFINSIYVYADKYIINYNCKQHQEAIPPDIKNVVCSELDYCGEPSTHNPNLFVSADKFGFVLPLYMK